jgi:hypothetical protein
MSYSVLEQLKKKLAKGSRIVAKATGRKRSCLRFKGPFGRALASPKTALALAHEVKPLL